VTAAAVVQRLAEYEPATRIHDIWRQFLEGMEYGEELVAPLLEPTSFREACDALPVGMGRQFHACTHTTFAPTIAHGGTKINVIPDRVDLQVDIRTLPGDGESEVRAMLDEALGDLAAKVELVSSVEDPSTSSPIDTPLWDSISRVTQGFYEGSKTVPFMTVGATDARFFRRLGTTSYGFGLFSTDLSFEDYGSMFHGDDERIDVTSLQLSTDMWEALSKDLLAG
jgi:acetylornithine deacetylase/succinyl-diaminopimelate desuccinylase-like protein